MPPAATLLTSCSFQCSYAADGSFRCGGGGGGSGNSGGSGDGRSGSAAKEAFFASAFSADSLTPSVKCGMNPTAETCEAASDADGCAWDRAGNRCTLKCMRFNDAGLCEATPLCRWTRSGRRSTCVPTQDKPPNCAGARTRADCAEPCQWGRDSTLAYACLPPAPREPRCAAYGTAAQCMLPCRWDFGARRCAMPAKNTNVWKA
jgi:hypothetical protein